MEGSIIFDWETRAELGFERRYLPSVRGRKGWQSLIVEKLEFWTNKDRDILHEDFGDLRREFLTESLFQESTPIDRPTVFISHRQADVQLARKAAGYFRRRGIDVWLDVEDPVLTGYNFGSKERDALLLAIIVEMALLNSTHVLAILTTNTQGSMWVPYEYGRVKQSRAIAHEAACLIVEQLGIPVNVPAYAYLGHRFKSFEPLKLWPNDASPFN